jgi:hypothetical protein
MKYHGKYYSTDYSHNSKLNYILKKMILSSLRMILFFFFQATSSTDTRMLISGNIAWYHCLGSCVLTHFLDKSFKILPLNIETNQSALNPLSKDTQIWGVLRTKSGFSKSQIVRNPLQPWKDMASFLGAPSIIHIFRHPSHEAMGE